MVDLVEVVGGLDCSGSQLYCGLAIWVNRPLSCQLLQMEEAQQISAVGGTALSVGLD